MNATPEMPDLSVLAHLCPVCRFGDRCPGYAKAATAGGGITCTSYAARSYKRDRLSKAHILALPDREPCSDCACRKGSEPNGTHHTMADFNSAVSEGEVFLCHADGVGRVCAGWLRAAKARAGLA